MWIVKAALRNPYTIGVLAALIFLVGILSIQSMRVDVFPTIDIPVVSIVWAYRGLSAEEMERRIVFVAERGYTTMVGGISKIESRSTPGLGVIRVYFQPGADIGSAIAQITSSSLSATRIMPPGVTPPNILQFNASNVPVAQLTVQGQGIPEEKLFDYAQNFVRLRLFTIPGLATPAPYGGKSREINIDIIPTLLSAKGLSPQDVVAALGNSNLIIPAGTARIGGLEYNVLLNSSPATVDQFNQIPLKIVGGRPVLLGEVAKVADAYADQTNIVRINGQRAAYLNILKKADASTLDVVDATHQALPFIQGTAPKGMIFHVDFDQSVFVRAAVQSVIREAIIAAILVSAMILLFLGSWRSVVIVCTSIPLSILCSIVALKATGNTLNIMTLGGLSLAIGMLVDDATVAVENIHRNMETSSSLTMAILKGSHQIALPAILATLAICVVFSPVILLTGPSRFLFVPMALSVVFAMLASYFLSRTLVPALTEILMKQSGEHQPSQSAWSRFLKKFENGFTRFQNAYAKFLELFLHQPKVVLGLFLALLLVSLTLPLTTIGKDFFPATDAGLMKIHYRARSGSRLEETEKNVAKLEERIHAIVPDNELETINSQVGPPDTFNVAFVPSDNIGPMDAEILVALKPTHQPTANYVKKIRADLNATFPGSSIYFQPADIMNQVLNFGVSSTLDIQIEAPNLNQGIEYAQEIRRKMLLIPGATDVNLSQVFDYPTLQMTVDRIRAAKLGLTQKDIAASMLISLSSSSLYAPNFYLNPQNNVNYFVVTKVPLNQIQSVDDLLRTPVSALSSFSSPLGINSLNLPHTQEEILGNLASIKTSTSFAQIDHLNVQRVLDITSGVEGRDLGSVASDVQSAIDSLGKLPIGVGIHIRGQSEVMNQAFKNLGLGVIIAILLVYLLMVVLFQSWLDPFIIMTALPGALVGILWMLALTGTSINVESMMGSIMAVGIAVSNSILLVSFANEVRVEKNLGAWAAALEAGKARLRPICMTALAMILGMIPMALGLGEGGEQNAPLGRAVIGGLLIATLATLLVVPVVYSLLRHERPKSIDIRKRVRESEREFDAELASLEI